jgi:hypothetical protein
MSNISLVTNLNLVLHEVMKAAAILLIACLETAFVGLVFKPFVIGKGDNLQVGLQFDF